jgi:mono/diheme cytochrome c family protein
MLAAALLVAPLVVGVVVGVVGTSRSASESGYAAVAAARGTKREQASYAEWAAAHERHGGDRNVTIQIGYWKALSSAFTRASGTATLNLIDGTVSVVASGLPADQAWDVWLVDNRPGPRTSVRPEATDRLINVGRLAREGDTAKVAATLGPRTFIDFHVDLVVVARSGGDPGQAGLLFGSPSVFQRLYTARRSERLLGASDFASFARAGALRPWAALLGPRPATAADTFVDEDTVFDELVRRGADLFINEKFAGNGRTCASCHAASANFTIDVNFIAHLPDDDALFVAEFTPALAFSPMGPKFEVPVLMRKAALIVENVDGTDDLVNKFTMRGVPHTLGMRHSLRPAAGDGTTQPPNQRTGWSGDGAPGTGTLREFATGAVNQHFTKTLGRVAGVDFRLPTDAELDAMEAFQLSLGRQSELALPLPLKDAKVVRGQELFMTPAPVGGSCNICHLNAGANASFGDRNNRNFNTGVENQLDRPAEVILRAHNIDLTPGIVTNILPRDGGFGQTPGEGPDASGFGNGTFNTVSVIEAADTGPFFHDNSIDTIEGAVAFYNSRAFLTSPSGPLAPINLQATQVEAIAAFLRAINALENIREATETAQAARTVANSNPRVSDQLLKQAIGDTLDAVSVLAGRGLHPAAVKALERAVAAFRAAALVNGFTTRIDRALIDRGITHLAAARADISN